MSSCCLLLAWVISALVTSSLATQQSPMSIFHRHLVFPPDLELLCSHVQGSRNFGGHGRLSYVLMTTNSTSNQHLVLVDEKYSQLHQGGLVSRSSCRWSWPSLHLTPLGDSWSTEFNCRRALLHPLDDRRLGLALTTSASKFGEDKNVGLELLVLDVTNCTWTKVAQLQYQSTPSYVDLRTSMWILSRQSASSGSTFEVLFNPQKWQDPSKKYGRSILCALAFDAISGEQVGEMTVLRRHLIDDLGQTSSERLLPVRTGATASLDGGYILMIETPDDLVIVVFDFGGVSASLVREPKPRGSPQLVVQKTSDEGHEEFAYDEKLGPLLRYCWLLQEGRAECISRGPALDLRSNVSLSLGYEGSDSGSLMEILHLGDSGENFLLLTRGGVNQDHDQKEETPYYLTELRKSGGNSSQWQRSLPLEVMLSSGPGEPFLASGDANSNSHCSIASSFTQRWPGRGIFVDIRCVPLRFLLDPDA